MEHVQYDAIDYGAFRAAADADFGVNAFPSYQFEEAEAVVTIGADFLGTFADSLSTLSVGPKPESQRMVPCPGLHAFETNMSLTGSNADYRTMVKPSEQGKCCNGIAGDATGQGMCSILVRRSARRGIRQRKDLKKAGSKGLVLAGSNDFAMQRVVNAINAALGAVGTTVFI